MSPVEIIAAVSVALIVGGAVLYIISAKKKGKKCIGCPYSSSCEGKCEGSSRTFGTGKNEKDNK